MILHLIHDDKVVPRMISQFEEVCPENNIFICVSKFKNKTDLRFLNNNSLIIMSQSKDVSNIPWDSVDKICFHYLSFKKIRYYWKLSILYDLRKTIKIWFFWGADIYDIIERLGYKMYSDENTFYKEKRRDNNITKFSIRQYIKQFKQCLSDYFIRYFYDKKFDYVVCNSKTEFDLFCKYVTFSKCKKLLNFFYYPVEDTMGGLADLRVQGDSIIIGNSASPSNNHEYVLQLLKDIPYGERKIYIPLNYSRYDNYVQVIEKKFKNLPNTRVLNDFMTLEEYHKLLSQCSTFIYGNFRAEAWGNILVALYLGGKVYVSNKSILPSYLESLGFIFFVTEDIKNTFFIELTQEEQEMNRNIVINNFSNKLNREFIKDICNL